MSCELQCGRPSVEITEDIFGQLQTSKGPKPVKRYTFKNSNDVSVQVMTYGGYITSIKVPDTDGNVDDIVFGFKTFDEYLQEGNRYFGATIGRVANRIAKGKMTIEGIGYQLAKNNGENHLHGGVRGFDKVIWESYVKNNVLILSYHAADMEENYPGDIVVNVSFKLTQNGEFIIDYKATTTKPTPVNMTNHSYFNLAGNGAGSAELYKHNVMINADRITEVVNGIPTGVLLDVKNTVFDLRKATLLGDVINKVPSSPGFDHNFCISNVSKGEVGLVGRVIHPPSGRVMEVCSNQPGVQFFTSNFQPETDTLKGKDGYIKKHGAFCLETQIFPDAINHENFPSPIIYPGELYHHKVSFKFFNLLRTL